MDARFRGQDEKGGITYADFGNEVLDLATASASALARGHFLPREAIRCSICFSLIFQFHLPNVAVLSGRKARRWPTSARISSIASTRRCFLNRRSIT